MSTGRDVEATVDAWPSTIPISQPDGTLKRGWVGTGSLPASGVVAGTYPANGASVPQITLTAAGTVSSESDLLIAIAGTQITSGLIPAARIQEVIALADLTDVTAKTGTGTVVAMQTSPAFVTPDLGTPSAGVGTNLTALNATQLTTGTLPDARLSNTITAGGPTGDATHSFQGTWDAHGRLTTVASVAITGTAPGGSAGGDLAGTYPNPTLVATAVTAGTYGATPGLAPQLTIDAKGRITAASDTTVHLANVFLIDNATSGVLFGRTTAGSGTGEEITPGSGVLTFIQTPTSANLKAALTDETGSGAAVFATSPTLVTPALGTPASGNLANCTMTGRRSTVTIITSGTGATFTTQSTTTSFDMWAWGPGGGGGGASHIAADCGAAGGGGAGGAAYKRYTGLSGATSYLYTIGPGGTAGTAGANAGSAGGSNTSFDNGGSTINAKPGQGGTAGTASAVAALNAGGAGAAVSTGGDVNGGGGAGGYGLALSGTVGISGNGGSTDWGGGGAAFTTEHAGSAGNGFGSGGSGALSLGTADKAGGAGAGGLIIIFEYT